MAQIAEHLAVDGGQAADDGSDARRRVGAAHAGRTAAARPAVAADAGAALPVRFSPGSSGPSQHCTRASPSSRVAGAVDLHRRHAALIPRYEGDALGRGVGRPFGVRAVHLAVIVALHRLQEPAEQRVEPDRA